MDSDDLTYVVNDTSLALLREARREFSQHGIAGGRVNRIAANAGVNKERLYAYFGSKERLFDLVVAEVLAELIESVPFDRGEGLGDHVIDSIRRHRATPDLPRLLLWEALHYGVDDLPASGRRAALYRRKIEAVSAVLGEATPGRAAAALFMIVGMATWAATGESLARLLASAAGPDGVPLEDLQAELDDLTRIAMNALSPDDGRGAGAAPSPSSSPDAPAEPGTTDQPRLPAPSQPDQAGRTSGE